MKSLEQHAKAEITKRLRELKGGAIFRPQRPEYVFAPKDNLIEGVTVADLETDLVQADGNELLDYTRKGVPMPAKFCAAYSSSALAVNTFGPLKHAPTELCVAGLGGFTRSLTFEKKCPNGLKEDNGRPSRPPHLDVLLEEDNRILAIESKFIEPISSKNQKFSPKYEAPFRGSSEHSPDAEPGWARLYEAVLAMKKLSKDKQRFQRLDAAQLIKHYLGLHVTYRGKPVTLVYLFWEPTNASELEPYHRHSAEVCDFTEALKPAVSHVRFKALSYRDLWDEWENDSRWLGMAAHLSRLRTRYDLRLSEQRHPL